MGCAAAPKIEVRYVYTPTALPEHFLDTPCSPFYPSGDVGSLYRANELNISCINQFSSMFEGIREYNKNIKGELGGGNIK